MSSHSLLVRFPDNWPNHISDLIDNSMPILYRKILHQPLRQCLPRWIGESRLVTHAHTHRLKHNATDRELLDGLRRVRFELSSGEDGSGFDILAFRKLSGYYLGQSPSRLLCRSCGTLSDRTTQTSVPAR